MEDTVTHSISIALYRYLCQHIVGSEDHVKQIRLMNSVRDTLSSKEESSIITSGSYGEGLDMRGSDFDIMLVSSILEVYEDLKLQFNPTKTYFSMETDDVKPGYAKLKLDYSRYQCILKQCEEQNGKHYYSSTLHKQSLLKDHQIVDTIHGPCVSDRKGYFDIASCLHCKTWVLSAEQWITRSNNSWPSHNVKRSIVKHGVLLVPIGVKGSSKEDLEWRVSFSLGEKFLFNTFTHTQLLCYALLKIILKDVIASFSECEDLLCSYFLKTIVFWISEELPQSVWKPENTIPCFMRCFSRLVYCVEHSVCLHYFIPENNMFENKIVGRAREKLLEKLYMLHSYKWRCILFSDQISNFDLSIWNFPTEPHTQYLNEVKKMLSSQLFYVVHINNVSFRTSNIVDTRMNQMYLCQQYSDFSIKDIYKFYISKGCQAHAQCVPLISTLSNNKYQYKQYKSCLSTVIKSINHDVASGWLMVATLFFKTKQYSKALYIVSYSLSKCTPEKLCFGMTLSDIHYQLLKLQTFQKKSLVCLLRILLVDDILFDDNSTLIPDELKLNQLNSFCGFPSTAYAYFLNFLCYYHLNDVRQCQDSLHGLQLVIDESYFMVTTYSEANAYHLLGVALQLLGDKESARHAFLQSARLFPDEYFNFAGKC